MMTALVKFKDWLPGRGDGAGRNDACCADIVFGIYKLYSSRWVISSAALFSILSPHPQHLKTKAGKPHIP